MGLLLLILVFWHCAWQRAELWREKELRDFREKLCVPLCKKDSEAVVKRGLKGPNMR